MGESIVIEFTWPYLFLLIPFPWLVYKLLPPSHSSENARLKVPAFSDFTSFQSPGTSSVTSKLKAIFIFMIWLALLTAGARPQWIGKPVELPQSGRDLMLAVDLSGSMQIQDFEINGKTIDRLSAIKLIASDFIERRQGDRIGLILFGTQAYLQTPLTFDLATVKQLLIETAVGLAGPETAIGDAIGLAVKQLRDRPQASRVLVLITDGVNNSGELTPEKAAEIASNERLKIHTIAIGSKQRPMQTAFGARMMVANGEIDEKALQQVAKITGGEYFRAYNSHELAQIYHHIDQLEQHEKTNQYFRPIQELYYWPLGVALACLGLLMSYEWIRRWQR
jgi:Ca-activated chloride channel homolog